MHGCKVTNNNPNRQTNCIFSYQKVVTEREEIRSLGSSDTFSRSLRYVLSEPQIRSLGASSETCNKKVYELMK